MVIVACHRHQSYLFPRFRGEGEKQLQRRARRRATINVVDFSDVTTCQNMVDVSDVTTCQKMVDVRDDEPFRYEFAAPLGT